jgi:hypothetical protein
MTEILIAIASLCYTPSNSNALTTKQYQLTCQQQYINCVYNKEASAKARKEQRLLGEHLAECVLEQRVN